jgi:hypothetical protein
LDLQDWKYEAHGEAQDKTINKKIRKYDGKIIEVDGEKNPFQTDLVVYEGMEGKLNYQGSELTFKVIEIMDEKKYRFCHKVKYFKDYKQDDDFEDEWLRLDLQRWNALAYDKTDKEKKIWYEGTITEVDGKRNPKIMKNKLQVYKKKYKNKN